MKKMSNRLKVALGIALSGFAIAASAQYIYGNSFPNWDVRGPLTTQTLVTSGNATVGGNLAVTGTITGSLPIPSIAPRTITGATDAPGATDVYLIANRAGTVTLTLPTVASNTGRRLCVKTIQAQTVVSDASNVAPSTSATPGTAILAGTAGKWACMVSDATSWVVMENN